jgi:hypothetical protein
LIDDQWRRREEGTLKGRVNIGLAGSLKINRFQNNKQTNNTLKVFNIKTPK